MRNDLKLNADRFLGFAKIYDDVRPRSPEKVREIILNYLGYKPSLVVDLGCGTGLSTTLWYGQSDKIIGIEPSADMLQIAKEKAANLANIGFVAAFSNNTGLDNYCADVITCSQSFHWMNPELTLNEVARVLKQGGIFAAYDYDWPPLCNWEVELEYNKLFEKVAEIESIYTNLKDNYVRWEKDKHLTKIKNGKFRYVREIVFANSENCDAQRLIGLALSQGGLQAILKAGIEEINPAVTVFKNKVLEVYGDSEFKIDFCYRMRMAVK